MKRNSLLITKARKGPLSGLGQSPPGDAYAHVNTCQLCDVNLYRGGQITPSLIGNRAWKLQPARGAILRIQKGSTANPAQVRLPLLSLRRSHLLFYRLAAIPTTSGTYCGDVPPLLPPVAWYARPGGTLADLAKSTLCDARFARLKLFGGNKDEAAIMGASSGGGSNHTLNIRVWRTQESKV